MQTVIGIDPGLNGAMALCVRQGDSVRVEAVVDLPTWNDTLKSTGKVRRYVDGNALAKIIAAWPRPDLIVCERLVAPPAIASTVAFSMGATQGTIQTILRAQEVRHVLVAARVWKQALAVPADKEQARQWVIKTLGSDKDIKRKLDHNRAEAIAIAIYGLLAL